MLNNTTNGTEKLWGKYRAEVVDNDDPKKRGRILVKSTNLIHNKPELGWAESCFMPGTFFIPRKGDFVWIEFENGDINLPIWVGIFPTRKYVKELLFSAFGDRINYDPYMYVITDGGNEIRFKNNDLKGHKHLIIKDYSGTEILFDGNEGNLNINVTDNLTNSAGGSISNGSGNLPSYVDPPIPKPIKPMKGENY